MNTKPVQSAVASTAGSSLAGGGATATPKIISTIVDSVSAVVTTVVLLAVIAVAWYFSPTGFITPESGIGYALGIVGSSMMAIMLIYPVRKRVKALRVLGSVKHWFRAHMMLGVVGPTLIVVHTNFSLGSPNGRVAFFCMIIVALSGYVGRYFYRQIHHGLYGQRASLRELKQQSLQLKENTSLASLGFENIGEQLNALEDEIDRPATSLVNGLIRPFRLTWTTRFIKMRLMRDMRTQLNQRAQESRVVKEQQRRLLKTTSRYLSQRLKVSRRILTFRLYERMFSLWHVLHIPLFVVLVITVIIHIYAVHAY